MTLTLVLALASLAMAADSIDVRDKHGSLPHVAWATTTAHGGAMSLEELPLRCPLEIGEQGFGRPPSSMSFTPDLTASFPADMTRLVQAWNTRYPDQQYRTEMTIGMVHIVPAKGLDADCQRVAVKSLLGQKINVPNQPRTRIELVTEVRAAMAKTAGINRVAWGSVLNGEQNNLQLIDVNTEQVTAREVMYEIFKHLEGTRGFAIVQGTAPDPMLSVMVFRLPTLRFHNKGLRAPFTLPPTGDVDGDGVENSVDPCHKTPPGTVERWLACPSEA